MKKTLQKLTTMQALMVAVLCLMCTYSINAQTDSVKWPVKTTVNSYTCTNVGNITGDSVRFAKAGSLYGEKVGSYLYYNGSYLNTIVGDPENDGVTRYPRIDFQNTYPGQSAAGWPASNIDTISGVWVQFRVSPNSGYKFHVNSITFGISGAGTGSIKAKAYISTDPGFAKKTEIFASTALGSYVFTNVSVTGMDTIVNDGRTLYLRIYPWLDNQSTAQTGKRFLIRNVVIKGTSESASTPVIPPAPVAIAATNITETGFSANWNASATAIGYKLDIATDAGFTSFVSGFNNLDVPSGTSVSVTGLTANTPYYYQVRAYNGVGTSTSSNSITATTAGVVSTDATLSALTVDAGTLSPAFAAGTITYNVVLPAGTTTVPTIAVTVAEAHATTVITQAPSVSGSGTVVVTAHDGNTKITYTVNFSVAAALSTDATLSALTVSAGTLFPAFAAATTTYSVVLPAGTTTVPTIAATVAETHATTIITQAPSVPGSGTVVVTAQDGTTKITYTVNFSFAAPAAPVASAATNISKTSFSANWAASTGATVYYLDVATDNAFTAYVSTALNNKDVGNVTTFSVTGLTAATTYYYRVRATNSGGTSANSNSITVLSLGTAVPTLAGEALKIAVSANSVGIESANNSIVAIQVIDVSGKLMIEKTIGATSVNISTEGWSSGIFVFTVQTQDGTVTKKIGIVK